MHMHPERGGIRGTVHNQVKENTADTESDQIGLRSVRKMVEIPQAELYTVVDTNRYTVCIAFDMISKYSGLDMVGH